jgi:murein DD-endopeptidase MepM/ murein hydrolase activator NlpD
MSTGNHRAEDDDHRLRHALAMQRLADALSEDILSTSGEELLIEVDEDHGDPRALAQVFNRVLARSVGQSLSHRIAERSTAFVMPLWRVVAPRPVMASSIAAVLIVMIASGLSMRMYPNPEPQGVASAPLVSTPAGTDRVIDGSANQSDQPGLREAASAERPSDPGLISPVPSPAPTVGAGLPPAPPALAEYSKRVRTITVHPGAPERHVGAASGASTSALHANSQAEAAQTAAAPLSAQRTVSGYASVASAEPRPLAAAPAPASAVAPTFIWPVRGSVIASFGSSRGGEANRGIDVAVPEGTDIHAADAGVVAYAGNLKGYGNLVLVRHDSGLVTAYAHASQLLVGKGNAVTRGQIIAKSGRSGDATEPQLHFEVRKGAAPVDPMPYLPPPG